jgi:hypothetical protein
MSDIPKAEVWVHTTRVQSRLEFQVTSQWVPDQLGWKEC